MTSCLSSFSSLVLVLACHKESERLATELSPQVLGRQWTVEHISLLVVAEWELSRVQLNSHWSTENQEEITTK
uniref:Secreted protein n=1 Tax=Anguilla anguilla TaxID=7936 RepID=A0A0E9WPZ9_ANGAN